MVIGVTSLSRCAGSQSALADTLRRRRLAALCSDARLIRAYPKTEERTLQAERLIREVRHEQSLGRITFDEQERILGMLSFAVEPMRLAPESAVRDESQ